jgi:hypothetical protein
MNNPPNPERLALLTLLQTVFAVYRSDFQYFTLLHSFQAKKKAFLLPLKI